MLVESRHINSSPRQNEISLNHNNNNFNVYILYHSIGILYSFLDNDLMA